MDSSQYPARIARHRIMVMSGKGGVGKTTVAVNLALGLALFGRSVGLLDADLTGPNVPKMLHMEDQGLEGDDGYLEPALLPVGPEGLKVVSMAFLAAKDQAVAWKGPLKISMLRQFVQRIDWGDLDYLVVDLPPGTGDEPISISQLLSPQGAIIVTTRHPVSLDDAARSIELASAMKIPVLGIVENMSGLRCPHCGRQVDPFCQEGAGGTPDELLGVPVLAKIELHSEISRSGDAGRPVILQSGNPAARSLEGLVERVIGMLETGTPI
ncbi:MAG: antiporter inner membrane protein [Methanosaeta sp. PtaB.Bin039]|nr:MAG: antiporter inner membrane protein [Methanosaeta sp. PtaB.Bin039]HOT08066.1 Mrp/NBP35 family ATP-binding protein [Methanotrichaceae archaeon]HQF17082.1 Mrp/NBP35 family ATP-binding protein [Methanotrichaceae archaeon]HQI91703.1 Mrp/NBP35 family ATP-binding protein [Methanotrichaceae archaeon]HQJ29472.1 Mrp/NBP35 family ATP-binding protein [Methanotrichaceae archaeon]